MEKYLEWVIFANLDNKQLLRFCIVNKNVCKHVAWANLLMKRFPKEFPSIEAIEDKHQWITHLPAVQLIDKAFKCFYYWSKGWSKVLIGPEQYPRFDVREINSVVKLNETKIVSGSGDSVALRVLDLNARVPPRELRGHENKVNCLVTLNETTIVSGSDDATLRVWDLELPGKAPRVLRQAPRELSHTDRVHWLLKLNESTVVSAGIDNPNLHSGDHKVLNGHECAVTSLVKMNEALLSGDADGTLRVWHGGVVSMPK